MSPLERPHSARSLVWRTSESAKRVIRPPLGRPKKLRSAPRTFQSGKKRLGVGRIMPNLVIHLAQGTQACPETLQGTLQERLEAPRSMAHNTQPYYTLGKGIFRNNKWLAASPLIRRDCPLERKKNTTCGYPRRRVFRAGLPPQRPSKSDLVDTAWRHANGHVGNTRRGLWEPNNLVRHNYIPAHV